MSESVCFNSWKEHNLKIYNYIILKQQSTIVQHYLQGKVTFKVLKSKRRKFKCLLSGNVLYCQPYKVKILAPVCTVCAISIKKLDTRSYFIAYNVTKRKLSGKKHRQKCVL